MKRVAMIMMMMMATQIGDNYDAVDEYGDNDDEYAKKMEEYHFR